MAWSLLAHQLNSGANAVTTTAVDTTGADQILVFVSSYDGVAAPTIADSAGNTWLKIEQFDYPTAFAYLTIWRAQGPVSTSATHTATVTATGGVPTAIIAAFSGSDAGTYEVIATNTASSTANFNTGSVTPGENNALVLSMAVVLGGGSAIAATSPQTLIDQVPYAAGVTFGTAASYYAQPAAGAINPAFTWTTTAAAMGATVVFKPAVAATATYVTEDARLPVPHARPAHRLAPTDDFISRVGVGTPGPILAEEPSARPHQRPFHRLPDIDQGSWPFAVQVLTVGPLIAEEPTRLPPRRPAHASPAQDEQSAALTAAPTVFKPIGEDDRRLPPRRPWHRLADVDQGGWPFTVVATTGRLVTEEPGRLPPRRPYHRTPNVDQGSWPFSVAPLNTATYLPEDEQHRPRQRPWHSMLTAHADLQVPPAAPTSLFYAYGQAGARSVG